MLVPTLGGHSAAREVTRLAPTAWDVSLKQNGLTISLSRVQINTKLRLACSLYAIDCCASAALYSARNHLVKRLQRLDNVTIEDHLADRD